MKYSHHPVPSDAESRRALNEKVLYLIDSGTAAQAGITGEDIYNAYTGDGGLHGLERKDFDSYHSYSEAKKEIENGQFFTPPNLCQLVAEVLKPSQFDLVADLTCGKGSFFNFFPMESNLYGCEIDAKACKMLYQIKVHPATREQYAKCCEYLHRFYTQEMPEGMDYKEWQRVKITEAKVLAYLRRALRKQNRAPERDVIALVKQNDNFVYKAYSAKTRSMLTGDMKTPVPVYQAVLDDEPERFPGFERLLRRRRREYDNQSQSFDDMAEDPAIGTWLKEFTLWDAENEEYIYLNDIQRRDINRMLQKRYGMLQWGQGSGKTLAAIAMGLYRMQNQGIHSRPPSDAPALLYIFQGCGMFSNRRWCRLLLRQNCLFPYRLRSAPSGGSFPSRLACSLLHAAFFLPGVPGTV